MCTQQNYDSLTLTHYFQVVPGGIAANCGKLRMGDRILKVNETNVTTATHQDAVMELLRPGDEIKLTIQHDPLPVGFQVSANRRANTADHSFS